MSDHISPFAPVSYVTMPVVKGVKFAVAECGIKYRGTKKTGKLDVMIAEFVSGTVVAGVFTKSKTCSANIIDGKNKIKQGKARVLVVNSGNANAFNGKNGEDSVARIVNECCRVWDCDQNEVYTSATGVIGQPLPDNLITDVVAELQTKMRDDAWHEAATAITTTDTYNKLATRTIEIDGKKVTINGIAKGSGMICPDMATMLSYIVTDANIDQDVLQHFIREATDSSFNSITVDSDTSTSDTLLIFATQQAGNKKIEKDNQVFKNAINEICLDLAHQIVKDGEGASKFITIKLTGAEDNKAAKVIAMAIANSPLVKTAIAGADANWGRIVMAVGKSGEEASRDKMLIRIGGITIVENGLPSPDYVESEVTEHMKGSYINIEVDVGVGQGSATVWTCDLTHQYISINADYRS